MRKIKQLAAFTLAFVMVLSNLVFAGNDSVSQEVSAKEKSLPAEEHLDAQTETITGDCGAVPGTVTWSLDTVSGNLTISGNGAMADEDEESPFAGFEDDIISVTIEEGVTSIGDYAFYYCENMETVSIPDSVTSIGDYAFYCCYDLETISIPENVTTIGDYAFYYCENMDTVSIPDSVTSIGDHAFYCCYDLETISIPENVTTIGDYTFYYCSYLHAVEIPEGVTSIGDYAFAYCDDLETVEIPKTVTSIGEYAFYYCYDLETVDILGSVTEMGSYAFTYCSNLETVTIHEGTTRIGYAAFYECDSLQTIVFPKSLTSIGGWAFDGTSWLDNELQKSDYVTANGILVYCNEKESVATVPEGVTGIGDDVFYSSDYTSINLPEGLTSIGYGAFSYSNNLSTINIPESVTQIEAWAFYETAWLANQIENDPLVIVNSIVVDGTACEGNVVVPDGIKYIADEAFYNCSEITGIVLPETLTRIGSWVFSNCSGLTSIYIPDSVTEIGEQVFDFYDDDTEKFTLNEELVISGGKGSAAQAYAKESGYPFVAYIDISFDANGGIGSMKAIRTKEDTAVVLSRNAFTKEDCTFVGWATDAAAKEAAYTDEQSVTFSDYTTLYAVWKENEKPAEQKDQDQNQGGKQNPDPGTSEPQPELAPPAKKGETVKNTAAGSAGADSKFVVTQPADSNGARGKVVYAGEGEKSSATELTIPDVIIGADGLTYQVVSVAANALAGNATVKKLIIGDKVVTLGKGAFKGMKALESVKLGKGVIAIESFCFADCAKLKTFIGNAVLEEMGESVFSGCKSFKSLDLSKAPLKKAGKSLMKGAKPKTIKIYAGKLKKFGKKSFAGLTKKNKILIYAKDKKTYDNAVKRIKRAGAKKAKFIWKKVKQ